MQILLSTYNGEKYIREQIESLINQINVEVRILVRDDGSTDNTLNILEEYKNIGVLTYYTGDNLKPAKSFMDLIYNAPKADYYAFCDQDDYWLPEKLFKAIDKIRGENNKPSLYFSKAQLVDEKLNIIIHKNYPIGVYTFGQALIKNNATGCTMVFNRSLLKSVRMYNPDFLTMHDYWVYLVCLALKGNVFYDPNSYILYRQHSSNVVGGKKSLINEYAHKLNMLVNREKHRSSLANELKKGYYGVIDDKYKILIDKIVNYHQSFGNKIKLIVDNDINSPKILDNLLLNIAILFGAF